METRKLSRREMLKVLGLGATGTLLAACGAPPATEAPATKAPEAAATATPTVISPTPAPAKAVKVTLWTYPDDDIYFNASLEDFGAQNPDITVEVVKLDTEDLDQKLTASMVGGAGAPDMVDLEEGFVGKYAAQRGFVNLLDAPYNIQEHEKDFPQFAFNAGYSADKSKFYFLNYSLSPAVIHYRRSLFEKAGLPSDPEEVRKLLCADWEAYLAEGEKLAKPAGPWFLDEAGEIYNTYWAQNSATFFDAQGKLSIANETNLKGLKLAKAARDKGLDAKLTLWTPEWENSFSQTTVATYLSGDWLQGLIRAYGGDATKGDWGMTPMPLKVGTMLTGSTLCITEQSANKDAAWTYFSYFSFNAKPQVQMYVLTFCFPGYKPAWDDPVMQEPVEWYGGQKARLVSVEVAKNFWDRPPITRYNREIRDIVSLEVANVLDKGEDPAQALADAEATAKTQLEL
jgi:multiple sugar transport system substrate-binding protein